MRKFKIKAKKNVIFLKTEMKLDSKNNKFQQENC